MQQHQHLHSVVSKRNQRFWIQSGYDEKGYIGCALYLMCRPKEKNKVYTFFFINYFAIVLDF